jgi:hypothetical protein
MEIGLIYSGKDPRQRRARNSLREYLRERGILADFTETETDVKSPTIIIDGHTLTDERRKPREKQPAMYPNVKDMLAALERHAWCL